MKVADTGIGIAPDLLPHVFELFTQADKTLDRALGGLGIGLTVARKLAEMHGGTVAADSAGVGQGSAFTVRLPLSDAVAGQGAGEPPKSAEPPVPLRILVVEDNHDTAETEALLLRAYGHEVQIAYDGPAAIDMARSFQPHAMLVDIGLPGMNGYEVAAKLRAEDLAPVSLIAVSGYGQVEDQQRSRAAGFDHHLIKPVDINTLFALLHGIRWDESPA